MTDHRRFAPAAALLALTLIWGSNWVVMKFALQAADPLPFAALRSILGGALLVLIAGKLSGRWRPHYPRHVLWLGLLQTVGFIGLVAWALQHGAVGKSAVLAYAMPFWALIFAALFLGEHIRPRQWPAIVLAGLGLLLIVAPWDADLALRSSLLALGAGLAWGAGVAVARGGPRLSGTVLMNVTGWQMLLGGLALGGASVAVPTHPIAWSWPFGLALLYNAVLASALAWLLWLFVAQRLPARVSGLSMLGTPVVSIVLAWIVYAEQPGWVTGLGMLCVLAALALLSLLPNGPRGESE